MIVTLEEVKQYLRLELDYTEEDGLITTLINAAEEHLKNATDKIFDNTNNVAKLYVNVLVSEYYSNRSFVEDAKLKCRYTLQSILLQLRYCEV